MGAASHRLPGTPADGMQYAQLGVEYVAREPEMNDPINEHVFVSLVPGIGGEDCISLELEDGQMMILTAAQARALASNLIGAVNRVEVKSSLRVSGNLWRREDDAKARRETDARFHKLSLAG